MTHNRLTQKTPFVAHLLHRAAQCADEVFSHHVGSTELTPRQFTVLEAIAMSHNPSQTTLVAMTGIDRSTMADIMRRLLAKGLVQRRRTLRDARAYAVRLTDKGLSFLDAVAPAVRKSDELLLAELPEPQRDAFVNTLTKIVENVGSLEPAEKSA